MTHSMTEEPKEKKPTLIPPVEAPKAALQTEMIKGMEERPPKNLRELEGREKKKKD